MIDDNPDLTTVVEAELQLRGYRTLSASDGEEGLRLAKEARPSLIILDLNLPKLRGLEVCRRIREDQDKIFSRTPIVMLTALSRDTDRVIGNVLGANHYFTKPFEPEVFWSKVDELLK